MAFTNQFALTVELTRLIPPVKWAADKAGDVIMNTARHLSHSGSDIVVEEDLANIFGRCRISDALTSSFKTIIMKSSSSVPLLDGILLQGGPGPTVARAFKESHYFSMVVQLSLLVWTFQTNYLATAIADALRERIADAPSVSGLHTSSGRTGILGVLRACESQTSAFNWNMMLNAVSNTLGHSADTAPVDFPTFVLQGLLDMFPMVQTLPNDRFIHIQVPVGKSLQSGTAALIVWAHHVLNLTVLVKSRGHNKPSTKNVRFGGSNMDQVIIEEVAADDEASITILDSDKENLLTIKPAPDEGCALIGSITRTPAKGWGNALFADFLWDPCLLKPNRRALIEDMKIVTSAFALVIVKHLVKHISDEDDRVDDGNDSRSTAIAYNVDEQHLLKASKFLFDDHRLKQREIEDQAAQYSSQALDEQLLQPPSLTATVRDDLPVAGRKRVIEDKWNQLCVYARKVAIFLIALAHVTNLEDCEGLMFAGLDLNGMYHHPLVQQLEEWDGKEAISVKDEAWLQALTLPIISHRAYIWSLPWDRVCLISDGGWSAWISTFGDVDPAYTQASSLRIGNGTPCRDGIWKSGIWDVTSSATILSTDPERAESSGQQASLRCSEKVTFDSPYCGEGDDVFLISARIRLHRSAAIYRIGYKSLQKCLWSAQISRPCSHGSREHQKITLRSGCVTIAGFGNYLAETAERILICLTAHSIGARWLALSQVPFTAVIEDDPDLHRQIFLRVNDCCFQCAIDQAAAQPGKWFIIL
ncbi:MAG: hypothetical protein Q9191_000312 [Dirinaria sp. TL-2023a]